MSDDIESKINRIFRRLEWGIEDLIDTAKSEVIAAIEGQPEQINRAAALQGKALTDYQWVARATSNDMSRTNLLYVRIRDGIAEATNGHLLLWCDTDIKTDGLYYITGKRADDDKQSLVNFPNTDEVKPSWDNWQPLVIEKQDSERAQVNGGNTVDVNFLRQITEGLPEEWEVAFSDQSTVQPLNLRHKTSSRRAVLMPRRDSVK